MRINFNIRDRSKAETSVNLIAYFDSHKVKLSTRQKVKTRYWNTRLQRAREHYSYHEALFVNSELDRIEKEVMSYLNRLTVNESTISKDHLRNELDNIIQKRVVDLSIMSFWEYFEAYIAYKRDRVTFSVIKDFHYSLRKHLKVCEKTYGMKLTFELMKHQMDGFTDHFEHYLMYEAEGKDGTPGLAINTVGKNIKNLKAFLNWCFDRDVIPRFSLSHLVTRSEEPETIYLSEASIDKLEGVEAITEEHGLVRDLFLIGCETGLRYSDFVNIKPHMLSSGQLKVYQKKTRTQVTIPMSRRVVRIINYYNNDLPTYNDITTFNKLLREMANKAGLNEEITLVRRKGIDFQYHQHPMYELISSHTARRSFCTNKFLKGMPSQAIMQFSGHKSEKSFMRYLRIDSALAAEKYREYF